MNRQLSIDRLVDPIEKVQEFLVPVSRLAFANHSSFEDIQGSEKCRCPVAFVIVCLTLREAGARRGSLLNLNDSTRCGCSLCFAQIRWTVAALAFCAAAIARMVQCVASLGVVFIVASTMAASCSPVIRFGRPLRGRYLKNPSQPVTPHWEVAY